MLIAVSQRWDLLGVLPHDLQAQCVGRYQPVMPGQSSCFRQASLMMVMLPDVLQLPAMAPAEAAG